MEIIQLVVYMLFKIGRINGRNSRKRLIKFYWYSFCKGIFSKFNNGTRNC